MSKTTRFKKGSRVRSTNDAWLSGLFPREKQPVYGEVATNSQAPGRRVTVRLDGNKRAGIYHVTFWEPSKRPERFR